MEMHERKSVDAGARSLSVLPTAFGTFALILSILIFDVRKTILCFINLFFISFNSILFFYF